MKTENGKEIKVVRDPISANFKIQFTSGGELPLELSGFFTKETLATNAVLRYLDSKKSK